MDSLFPDLKTEPPPEMLSGKDVITAGSAASWACFSSDRRFRYLLARQWDDTAPWFVIGMKNPSVAGDHEDDPTVRRVIGYAKRERCGGILVWNAGAGIATDPREWLKSADPIGPRNDDAIRAAVKRPILAVCVLAWGCPRNRKESRILTRAKALALTLRKHRQLGEATTDGWPRHPLYQSLGAPLMELGTRDHLTLAQERKRHEQPT